MLRNLQARRRPPQKPRQTLLALAQRHRPQVDPIQLQEVEGLKDRLPHGAAAVQGVKYGDTVRSADHSLTVKGEDRAVTLAAAPAIEG